MQADDKIRSSCDVLSLTTKPIQKRLNRTKAPRNRHISPRRLRFIDMLSDKQYLRMKVEECNPQVLLADTFSSDFIGSRYSLKSRSSATELIGLALLLRRDSSLSNLNNEAKMQKTDAKTRNATPRDRGIQAERVPTPATESAVTDSISPKRVSSTLETLESDYHARITAIRSEIQTEKEEILERIETEERLQLADLYAKEDLYLMRAQQEYVKQRNVLLGDAPAIQTFSSSGSQPRGQTERHIGDETAELIASGLNTSISDTTKR